MKGGRRAQVRPIGVIRSILKTRGKAPKLGSEGAPDAWLEVSRILAGELGPSGVRVVCLRPDVIPEALPISHAREVFAGYAERAGMPIETIQAEHAETGTLLGRFPTLAEVGDGAAFVASDRAGAMTGAIVNLTCGSVVD